MRHLVAAIVLLLAGAASAQELRIGVASEPTTMDPQFYNLTPNSETAAYVFDTLVWSDAEGKLIPWLAKSWRLVDERTWEFALREGVTFHDGTPFTVDDVLASFSRVPTVPNSPSNYAKFLSHIAQTEVLGPYTLRLVTTEPYPSLAADLTQIAIIPRRSQSATSPEFNAGRAMVGTGPYKFVEWVPGDRIVYTRNDAFWGRKPAWERVVIKPLGNAAARTAALLSRTVDLINQVPPEDLPTLQARPDIAIHQGPEIRLMYIAVDSTRDQSPFVTAKDGKQLDPSPLRDPRVREAMSKALDRTALVDKLMNGQAVAAGDVQPAGTLGTLPDAQPEAYDPAGARRLLAEAGYPDGFAITIHGPNDRYLNDAKVVQAVAQFFSRVGIATKVETMPKSVYFTKVAKREFSVFLIGTTAILGTGTLSMQTYLFATRDPAKLMGAGNWTYYSRPQVDALVAKALTTVDDGAREALLREAGRIVLLERPILPLFFGTNSWAMRTTLDYPARVDSYTLAAEAVPVR